ncbi:MAG: hypothetical protein ACLQVD_16910 [Capsulimonadaceae bacterium]
MTSFVSDSDWGHQLAGANQIIHGEHPFIDWRSTYGPYVFYFSALALSLAGHRAIGEILLSAVGYSVGYLLFWLAVKKLTGSRGVAAVFLALALLLLPRQYKYYILLCPMVALHLAWRQVTRPGRLSALVAGVGISSVFLVRPDFGVYFALAVIASILVVDRRLSVVGPKLLSIMPGVAVGATPWIVWCCVRGGLGNYVLDTVFGVPQHGHGMNLPFPIYDMGRPLAGPENLFAILFWSYSAIPTLAALVDVASIKRRLLSPSGVGTSAQANYATLSGPRQGFCPIALTAVVLAQLTMVQAYERSDFGHLLQGIPVSLILLAWLWRTAFEMKPRSVYSSLLAISVGTMVALSVLASVTLGDLPRIDPRGVSADLAVFAGPRDRLASVALGRDNSDEVAKAIVYVQRHTRAGDRILALPLLTSMYYVADRPFGGGQMGLVPGFFIGQSDQLKMIGRLSKQPVHLVLDEPDREFDGMPARRGRVFAATVYRYIDDNTSVAARFGGIVVRQWDSHHANRSMPVMSR